MVCVRCGDEPRHLDTFMCIVCLNDGGTRTDLDEARRVCGESITSQRAYLIENVGWHGGWLSRTPVEGAAA